MERKESTERNLSQDEQTKGTTDETSPNGATSEIRLRTPDFVKQYFEILFSW